jgi:hypothetical protein
MSELELKLTENATVRATINANGENLVSVYDVLDLACPNKCDSWTKMTWKRLIAEDSEFKNEIKFTMEYLKYQDVTYKEIKSLNEQGVTLNNAKKRRFRKTPVMTLPEIQRLLMILGGRVAAEFRQIVLSVFNRYMAGDRSMITEIHSNAASSAPIHQAYRQALAQEPVNTTTTKRMLDHDEAIFNMELHERQMALQERIFELHERSARLPLELYERSLALHERSLALQKKN